MFGQNDEIAGGEEQAYQHLLVDRTDGVVHLAFNRPEALNCLSPGMVDELIDVLNQLASDDSVKVLVLRGAGRSFCTGADLKVVIRLLDQWPEYVEFLYRLTKTAVLLENLPFPTIARVHGYALAGGLELLLCCDMAIAADSSKIGDQHSNVGMIPGAGGIPRLTRRIGRQAAFELLYTGEWLSGPEAAARGVVLRSVPEAELDTEIEKLTSVLATKSRTAAGYVKRVVNRSVDLPLPATLDEERAALLEYLSTSMHPRAGIDAFLERRPPVFD